MTKSPNGHAVATEPTIDVEELRQLTRQARAGITQEELEEIVERAERIVAALPQAIREAALKGDISVDPLVIENELDQRTSELVGLWCKRQGLTVYYLPVGDEDAPHSPPLYTVLHVCWPIEGPFGVQGG